VTEQDRRRFHEGQAWFSHHSSKGSLKEDVLSEFGFKPEGFPRSPEDGR